MELVELVAEFQGGFMKDSGVAFLAEFPRNSK